MKFIFIFCLAFTMFSCKNEQAKSEVTASQAAADSASYTSILFTDASQDLGSLNMGVKAEIKFHFKNTGDKPLFVISAQPSCGCTVADFPKEAIAPGDEGVIVANFDTNKGQPGNFSKVITVATNTKPNSNHTLIFLGEIKTKDGNVQETAKPVETPTEKKTN